MAGNSAFRKIIRSCRVINEAADLLDEMAQSISDCEQIEGQWPFGTDEAKEHHDRAKKTAAGLRALILPRSETDHAA